jgi:DNA polymerase-3 subunit delta
MENLYLLSGDDEYSKSEYLSRLKESFGELKKGVNFLQFDKDNISMLPQELTTYSFFADSKLIIVNVPKSKSSSDDEEEETTKKSSNSDFYTDTLEESIINKIESITLVFVEDGSSKGKLNKLITKYGKVLEFEKKKPNELVSWVTTESLARGVKINKETALYLVEVCGAVKRTIATELTKLSSYVENGEITINDINDVCFISTEISIFSLTDNLGSRKLKDAFRDLDNLLINKEPIQKILIMLTKHFKSLLLAKECLEKGRNVEKELEIKSYPALKYSNQSKNFTKGELIRIFKDLAELDISAKTSNIDIKMGIQKIMMG